MAKPNYDFAKRQRELAKAAKKEAKRLKKLAGGDDTPAEATDTETPGVAPAADKPAAG